jgi:hypothetical protein
LAIRHSASTRTKTLGIVLIVLVGLLNFHLPHFLFERAAFAGDSTADIELVFLANLLGAVIAGVAIWRNRPWGWLLGVLVVVLSFALHVGQETVGLPGLPKNWLEPSGIVSLIIEALFTLVAANQLVATRGHAPV